MNTLCSIYDYLVMSPGFQIQFLTTLLFDWPVTFEKGHLLILTGEDFPGAL